MRLLEFWLSGRMLVIGTAGFLAGYLMMPSVELQLQWLLVTCLPAGIASLVRERGAGMMREPLLRLAAAFLLWNLAVGVARSVHAFETFYTFEFLAGSLLLPVYAGCLWLVCRKEQTARRLLIVLAGAGLIAAVAGLYCWRFHQTVEIPGDRLRNPLVHNGQHPVASGMCMAFALLAAATLYSRLRTGLLRTALLAAVAAIMLAVMLTLSRGALLALACAPLAFLMPLLSAAAKALSRRQDVRAAIHPYGQSLQKAWPPLLTAVAVAVWFQFFGWTLSPALPPAESTAGAQVIHLETLNHDPLQEFIARSSTGRTTFYRMGLAWMDTWDQHLTGAGLWEPELMLEKEVGMNHFHSLYIATYIHSGIIGTAMLAAMLLLALRKALALLRAGEPEWLALLAFGMGGLMFDGQSACSLVTHPRFENLILWFPLMAVAARWRSVQTGRQLSSSESR